jgi:predicted dehydrogenase
MADNLNYLLGPASKVAAFSKQVIHVSNLDDATVASLEFSTGPVAFIGTSMVIPDIGRTALWGTEAAGWNEMDGARFYLQRVGERERTEQPVDVLDTVKDELEEFAVNVRTGATAETGGQEGLEAVAILEGIVESAATGRVVDLDEVRARA